MFGKNKQQNDENTGVVQEPVADDSLGAHDNPVTDAPGTPPVVTAPMVNADTHQQDEQVIAAPPPEEPEPEPAPEPQHEQVVLPQQQETPEPQAQETALPQPATDDDLLTIKQKALQDLDPLIDKLDQTPEEKFKTTMMMIQATDNSGLLNSAYQTAQKITDEKTRAQALLDVVNEINYFTQHQQN